MPIISNIGRKSLKARTLIWSIYGMLILGSITMIYPFLLLISGSSKSPVDTPDAKVIPAFLINDTALYRKYVESLFNEELGMMRQVYNSTSPAFRELDPPKKPNEKLVKEWSTFLDEAELPGYTCFTGDTYSKTGVLPLELRRFKAKLNTEFDGSMEKLNRGLQTDFMSWNRIFVKPEAYLQRNKKYLRNTFWDRFYEFKKETRKVDRYYFSVEGFYKTEFLKTQYSKKIEEYNRAHNTAYKSYDNIHLDRRYPEGTGRTQLEQKDWEDFVRTVINLLWVRVDDKPTAQYQNFLMAKYDSIKSINKNYATSYKSKNEIIFTNKCPESGMASSDWEAFLQGWQDPDTGKMYLMPIKSVSIDSTDFMFRDYLKKKYGNVAKLNQVCSTDFVAINAIIPPQQDWHYLDFQNRQGSLMWEFSIRNFITVAQYVLLHGRAIYNTTVYCLLAIFCALVFNPLAAYALSRYKPASTYKILLFLMMVMAFPPMVTQIPIFLMLREFNLLNTFWALVLPSVANGYSIFLLKGFFDSLPKELYESAELDGAGEFRIFWQFTMALSKPILAVIALQAFNMAYGNFMMALLICQDEKMWTLMPWIYQLQMYSGEGIIYASILIAAIPTFILFIFCQNIIMRGIVVPSEK